MTGPLLPLPPARRWHRHHLLPAWHSSDRELSTHGWLWVLPTAVVLTASLAQLRQLPAAAVGLARRQVGSEMRHGAYVHVNSSDVGTATSWYWCMPVPQYQGERLARHKPALFASKNTAEAALKKSHLCITAVCITATSVSWTPSELRTELRRALPRDSFAPWENISPPGSWCMPQKLLPFKPSKHHVLNASSE